MASVKLNIILKIYGDFLVNHFIFRGCIYIVEVVSSLTEKNGVVHLAE